MLVGIVSISDNLEENNHDIGITIIVQPGSVGRMSTITFSFHEALFLPLITLVQQIDSEKHAIIEGYNRSLERDELPNKPGK